MSHKTQMNGRGESYSGIVPAKQPNEGPGGLKEAVEGGLLNKENTAVQLVPDTGPGKRAKRVRPCAAGGEE